MKSKDLVIAIIALISAYFIFKFLRAITMDIIEIAIILIIAYAVYSFLKKLL